MTDGGPALRAIDHNGHVPGPLEVAALDAETEADSLRADAIGAMTLEGESDVLYDRATDALDAYQRARERARFARNWPTTTAAATTPGRTYDAP